MKYYSTNKQAPIASLQEAVVKGLAADKGLFMPMSIKPLPQEFYDTIDTLSFQEIAYRVADAFFGEDIPAETLKQIVYDTLSFDVPLVKVSENIYSLELFHGPTLAFKDVGGRFMARLLGYFIKKEGQKNVNVLVATSGDTGSAVRRRIRSSCPVGAGHARPAALPLPPIYLLLRREGSCLLQTLPLTSRLAFSFPYNHQQIHTIHRNRR